MADSGTTATTATAATAATACHACDQTSKLVDCVGCGQKVCTAHRGAGGANYRTSGDKEGYACQACVAAGRAAEKGTFADWHTISVGVGRIGDTLSNLKTDLLPAVMKEVDARLAEIREKTAPAITDDAVAKLTLSSQKITEQLKDGIDGRIDKLTAAVETLNPSKLLWQAGLVFGLVNVATVIAAIYIAKHM